MVVAALLFLEKNGVVAIPGPKTGIRAGNERLRAAPDLDKSSSGFVTHGPAGNLGTGSG